MWMQLFEGIGILAQRGLTLGPKYLQMLRVASTVFRKRRGLGLPYSFQAQIHRGRVSTFNLQASSRLI